MAKNFSVFLKSLALIKNIIVIVEEPFDDGKSVRSSTYDPMKFLKQHKQRNTEKEKKDTVNKPFYIGQDEEDDPMIENLRSYKLTKLRQ